MFRAGGTGGHSLAERFVNQHFCTCYMANVYDSYRVERNIDDRRALFDIRIPGAQEEYSGFWPSTISDSEAFLVGFSLTSKESLSQVTQHVNRIREQKGMDVPIVIFANKCDLVEAREISSQQVQTLAMNLRCPYVEISVLKNINVDLLFYSLKRLTLKPDTILNKDRFLLTASYLALRNNSMDILKSLLNQLTETMRLNLLRDVLECNDLNASRLLLSESISWDEYDLRRVYRRMLELKDMNVDNHEICELLVNRGNFETNNNYKKLKHKK
ncbi:MAG: hypothetical protein AB7F64_04000, partial [Gammaproteobacteria bacterium]